MSNISITVKLEGKNYPIIIGNGVIEDLPRQLGSFTQSRRVFLLSDEVFRGGYCDELTRNLKENGFEVITSYVVGGKADKTIYRALSLLDMLESMEFTRDSTFVVLGGGVIGDVGGFVAATFFRGMNLVHIPTTVTAQIDSAIGGKVAVNHNTTINAIGTYYHPRVILIDMDFLKELPRREFHSGMGEVIKSAFIKDVGFIDYLLAHSQDIISKQPDALAEVIRRTVQIKLFHVEADMREEGVRLYLNYGHTIGQAIEIASGLGREVYRHGEAVGLGMVAAAKLADLYYNDGVDRYNAHVKLLQAYQLPVTINVESIGMGAQSLRRSIYANLFKDKKRVAGGFRFVLIPEFGRAETVHNVSSRDIKSAINCLFE